MTDVDGRDALVEQMAEAIENETGYDIIHCAKLARAALAVAEPAIQAAERERCAKAVEEAPPWGMGTHARDHIAAAIRAPTSPHHPR